LRKSNDWDNIVAKNEIQIVGGDDDSFDIGDYILFYDWSL